MGRPRKEVVEARTKPDEEGEFAPEQLQYLDFKTLREIAIKKGIDVIGKTKKDLQLILGAKKEGTVVVNLGEGLTREQIDERRNKGMRIPGNVRYLEKDEDKIWKIWEKNPEAFDGVDFSDENATVRFVFDKHVECKCGAKFPMWRQYKVRETMADGEKITKIVDDKESMNLAQLEKYCPKCGIKYIYNDPDRVPEVAKV